MAREDVLPILMRDPWFASLPGELTALIVKNSFEREFPAGKLIFATDDEPNGQFAVLSGEVRLVFHAAHGREVLFDIFRPGAWFGHLSVLDGLPRFQDAIACGPTRVLQLPMAGFHDIVARKPEYVIEFSRLICHHIRVAMQAIVDARTAPFPARLAQILMGLESLPDGAGKATPEQRVTQDALAAMTGTSRQTVSRLLKRWERAGVVSLHYGRVLVHRHDLLSDVAQRKTTGRSFRPGRDMTRGEQGGWRPAALA